MNYQKLKRILKIMILTSLTIGIIGVVLFEEFAMPYMPISPWKRSSDQTPAQYGIRYEDITIEVEKGLILRGYFLLANIPKPKATIISIHGIGGFKEGYLGFSKLLTDNGFNVVIYDQRAHGKSDGKYCTFGYYEKHDVSKIIDFIEKRNPKLPIGVHGSSLGGAVALQTLAIEKRLCFGIVESTFHRLEDIVIEYGYDFFKFRSRWLARRVLSKAADIAQFKPFDIKPVEAAAKIEQPMLLIHGDKDTKIPIEFNKENFAALKSKDKEFYTVEGAHHQNVGAIGGKNYVEKIMHFLERNCSR